MLSENNVVGKRSVNSLFHYNRDIKQHATLQKSYFQREEYRCNKTNSDVNLFIDLQNKVLNKLFVVKNNFLNLIASLENEFPTKINKFLEFVEITTPSDICGYLVWFISDFLTSEKLEINVLTVVLVINFIKISEIFKKFLTHENSKKIYFYMYVVAISIILAECTLLLTSPVRNISDQGIMFLYIYVTAILMLFLIFLTLTTCESYLSKESIKDNLFLKSEKLNSSILSLSFLSIPFLYLYGLTVSEIASMYKLKLSVFETGKNLNINWSAASSLHVQKLNTNGGIFEDGPNVKNIWSVFDSLKFDILDTYFSYILSAVLQSSALIIVILSLII